MGRPQRLGGADKLAEAHQRLSRAVAELVSGEDWRAFLTMAAKLHSYSANNVFLIMRQAPWASRVAGYKTWKELGRQVRAGEQGIAVLAPCGYRKGAAGAPADDRAADDGEEPGGLVVRGFRVVYVFDINQTDGRALVQRPRPQLLEGQAPPGLWAALAGQVQAAGYRVEREGCGDANGSTSFESRLVRVRDDVDDAMAVKTLAHELAHVVLHDGSEYAAGCRGRCEVEAESVAFLVCDRAGMLSDRYSFAYVAHWSGGDGEVVRAAAQRVLGCAGHIIASVDNEAR